jgi:hypothetical protein
MTVTTPNCRTCNDSGLIPAEHGNQPCPMCDAWEALTKPPRITTYFTSDTPQSVPRRPTKSRAHVSAVDDICGRSEYIHPAYHGEEEDEEPPSDWVEVAIYLAIAAVAVIAVGLAHGVVG